MFGVQLSVTSHSDVPRTFKLQTLRDTVNAQAAKLLPGLRMHQGFSTKSKNCASYLEAA